MTAFSIERDRSGTLNKTSKKPDYTKKDFGQL